MRHAALLMHRRFESLTAGITDRRIPEELDQRCVRYRRGAKDDGIRGKKAQLREPRCGHDDARDSNRKANKKRKKVRVQVETGFLPWHAPFASANAERGKGNTSFPYVETTTANRLTESERKESFDNRD